MHETLNRTPFEDVFTRRENAPMKTVSVNGGTMQ